MQRRKALKNIGLSLGGITMSATVVSLLKSCSDSPVKWDSKFFSPDEAEVVAKTLDAILPSDPDIPGAAELNLTQFIDSYIHEISSEKEKEGFKAGISQYLSSTLEITGKSNPNNLTSEDIEERLAYYLKADPSQQNAWNKEVNSALKKEGQIPSVHAANFSVLKSLRQRAISAFKGTEIIGENILAYDPRPGKQEGCIDLQTATNGKAWSL